MNRANAEVWQKSWHEYDLHFAFLTSQIHEFLIKNKRSEIIPSYVKQSVGWYEYFEKICFPLVRSAENENPTSGINIHFFVTSMNSFYGGEWKRHTTLGASCSIYYTQILWLQPQWLLARNAEWRALYGQTHRHAHAARHSNHVFLERRFPKGSDWSGRQMNVLAVLDFSSSAFMSCERDFDSPVIELN